LHEGSGIKPVYGFAIRGEKCQVKAWPRWRDSLGLQLYGENIELAGRAIAYSVVRGPNANEAKWRQRGIIERG
jgi:hypothetical protein